jgi:3-deoxy-D-manno-octulosonic-acid transferase
MVSILYNVGIFFLNLVIHIHAVFNKKSNLWIQGRKNDFSFPKQKIESRPIWFHCASLGEFEQGRPLIEAIKKEFPHEKILLTFFSPSGYEIRKEYPNADYIVYLPLDSDNNAKRWIKEWNPKMAIFIKYEFWFNFLYYLNLNSIPTYFVSTTFRKNQFFFNPFISFFRNRIRFVNMFFLLDESSKLLLSEVGITNSMVTGDTRIDMVIKNREEINGCSNEIEIVKKFRKNRKMFILGSVWKSDYSHLKNALNFLIDNGWCILVAPHELMNKNIDLWKSISVDNTLFSAWVNNEKSLDNKDFKVMILDTMGMLPFIYREAEIAYIGGGFETGIHNILEPAVYGMPIIFGPKHTKYTEAVLLKKTGAGYSGNNENEIEIIVKNLIKESDNKKSNHNPWEVSKRFIDDQSGSTLKIMSFLKSQKLFETV